MLRLWRNNCFSIAVLKINHEEHEGLEERPIKTTIPKKLHDLHDLHGEKKSCNQLRRTLMKHSRSSFTLTVFFTLLFPGIANFE